ncbi:MAG: HesA/MoeB/ThiF family protein [Bacteroidales bacterium]|nr:MAG: HesA/MoeB/ThiF family protein [Bacteroidales bacterium]
MSLKPQELRRYSRQMMISEIGKEGQEKLKNVSVLVVGAGGLGCPVMQYLSAAGIGKLGIMDADKVDEANLHRQILYGSYDLGKLKSIIAKTRLAYQNPLVDYEVFNIKLQSKNALEIIGRYDIIVDATDNFPSRYLINDACVICGKPMVYGSIYKFEGQLSVFNYNGGPTYRCLYPEIPEKHEAPEPSEIGVIGVLPGLIGTLQAIEVIKMAIGKGKIVSGELLIVNILYPSMYTIRIRKNEKNLSITEMENP